jgi:peptidoglycan-N-acetylglucosamine deacetylase
MRSIVTLSIFLFLFHSVANASPRKDRAYYETRGEVVWEITTDEKVIALTFDDGPNPFYTPQILVLLKEYGARATFFVTGMQVQKYPELAKRQVQEGHELGNHMYSHPKISRLATDQIRQELAQTERSIIAATGQKPPLLFRPPGGYIDQTVVDVAKHAGYIVVLWSFHQDTQDWKRPGVRKIVRKVVDHANGDDIVLFHDHGGNRGQTVRALKQILPSLQKQGYRFVTVSELLEEQNIRDLYRIPFMEPSIFSPLSLDTSP